MDTTLKLAKISFFFALCVLCVAAADTLKHVRTAADSLNAALQVAATTVGDADHTIASVDARLNGHGGIFDIVKATALHADRAVGEAAIASRQQRVAAGRMDEEILGTISHVNTTMDGLAGNIRATTEDVHNSLIRVPALLDSTTLAINAANRTISNPDITRTLSEIAETTKHVDGVAAHLEAMSGDLDKSLHKTLNPSKKSLALGYVMTALKFGAALSPLY